MIITLKELNRCVDALPEPHIAREMNRTHWRVAVVPDMPVQLLYDKPDSIGPNISIATFELKHIREDGQLSWRWAPCDELIID